MQKKLLGVGLITTLAMALTVAFASVNPGNITYALNRGMKEAVGTSTEYSAVVSARVSINNSIKYLTYNGGINMEEAANEEDSYFTLTWSNGNATECTITKGEYSLGHKDKDTQLQNSTSTWTIHDGLVGYVDTKPANRALIWRASTYNYGRAYAESNLENAEYYPIYFYTTEQLTNWEGHCSGDFAHACLSNLAYTVPSGGETPVDPPTPTEYTATLIAGTNGSACTVNSKDGIKVGTSKAGGDMSIKVSQGATKLVFYAAAWKGVSGLSLNISGGTCSPSSINLTADDGISNNSPFTLSGDENNFKFELTINATEETTFKLTSSIAKRFVVWNASCE